MFVPGIYEVNQYPIVTNNSPTIPVGTIVYFQNGIFGTPIGLLLSLTKTPLFIKSLKTSNGLFQVS